MPGDVEKIADKIGVYAPQGQIHITNLAIGHDASKNPEVTKTETFELRAIQVKQENSYQNNYCNRIRKNILLEIFNPDSRLALGIFDDLDVKNQYKFLFKALNISIFLCDDFVIMPPTFLLECPVVLKLIKSVSLFMEEGIIRLPVRDRSFSEFYDKKLEEYSEVVENYPEMFAKMGTQAVNLMKKYSHTRIERNAKIGQGLAQIWAEGPDVNSYWKRHINLIPSEIVDTVRYIPTTLHSRGRAVTWGLIAKESPYQQTGMPVTVIQKLLQHSYAALYIKEYDLKVVSNLPFSQDSFGHGLNNLPYDYEALKAALKPLGLFDIVLSLSPEEMILLRYLHGYGMFIDVFDRVAHDCVSVSQIRKCFAMAAAACASKIKQYELNLEKIVSSKSESMNHEKVCLIEQILLEASLTFS